MSSISQIPALQTDSTTLFKQRRLILVVSLGIFTASLLGCSNSIAGIKDISDFQMSHFLIKMKETEFAAIWRARKADVIKCSLRGGRSSGAIPQ